VKPDRRKILLFVLQFVPLFAIMLWLYGIVVPNYQPLAVGAANAITERLQPPTRMEITHDGGWLGHVFTPKRGSRSLLRWKGHVPHLFYLSAPLLIALLLATPAPIPTRLRWLAIALPLIFIVHVLSIAGLTRGVYCLKMAPGTFYCLWMLRIVYVSGQIFAALLWALLSWRYWSPGKQAPVKE